MLVTALVMSLLAVNLEPEVDCAAAMTTLDINACAGRALAAEDARMQSYLATAVDRLREGAETPEQAEHLVGELEASQAAWKAYTQSACAAVYSRWQGGTIRTVMAVTCKERLTQQRSLFLWREYLTFIDSSPAVPAGTLASSIQG